MYDVTRAITKLMDTPDAFGKVINIGSDTPISILELATRVIETCDSNSVIEFMTYTEAYDESFEDIRRRVPDLTRIRNMIGDPNEHDIDQIIRDVRDSLT